MAIKPLKTIKFPGLPDTYTVPQVDSTPIQDSTNAVSSGGVYTEIEKIQNNLINLDSLFPVVRSIKFESGGIGVSGGITSSNTRIRTQQSGLTQIKSGDCVYVDSAYEAKVMAYSNPSISSTYFIEEISTGWFNGLLHISSEYEGKYIGILICKVGQESTDISADVNIINEHIKYYSNKSGIENLIALDSIPSLKWTYNKIVTAQGAVNDSRYYAITQIIDCEKGDIFYNHTSTVDALSGLSCYHILYKTVNTPNDTFYQRVGASSTRKMVIPEDVTGYQFMFGRTTSGDVPINAGDAEANVDLEIWRKSPSYEYLNSFSQKNIKILCIGNSFSQDSVAYMPYILRGLTDKIKLTLGIAYYGGGGIDDYVEFFDNDTPSVTFNRLGADDDVWTSTSGQTLKQILNAEPWDIVTFQQKSTAQESWDTYSNLNTLIDDVVGYIISTHKKNVRVGWLMPQIRYKSSTTDSYANMVECVHKVLETTPCNFVIPCGTAIQYARQTNFDSVGDSEHLTYDGAHLQEGLPCLLSAYVTTIKVLELLGIGYKHIIGEQTRPTQAWIDSHVIPGQNGTSVGITEENCYLAQKLAIQAVKYPYGYDYGVPVIDPTPTQDSPNAVSSGAVWDITNNINDANILLNTLDGKIKNVPFGRSGTVNGVAVEYAEGKVRINGTLSNNLVLEADADAALVGEEREIPYRNGATSGLFEDNANARKVHVDAGRYRLVYNMLSGTVTKGGVTYTSNADFGSTNVVRAFILTPDASSEGYTLFKSNVTTEVDLEDGNIGIQILYCYNGCSFDNAVFELYLEKVVEEELPDTTLTEEGKPADAKAAGDAIKDVNRDVDDAQVLINASTNKVKNIPLYRSGTAGELTVEYKYGKVTINGTLTQNAVVLEADADRVYTGASAPEIPYRQGFTSGLFSDNVLARKVPIQTGRYRFVFNMLSGSVTKGDITYTSNEQFGTTNVVNAFLLKSDASSEGYTLIKTNVTTEETLDVTEIGMQVLYCYNGCSFDNAVFELYLETVKEEPIPYYWNSEIDRAVSQIQSNIINASAVGSTTVCFVTDCHWKTNEKHSPYIIKDIFSKCNVNYFVNGGDILYRHTTTKQEAIDEITDCINAFRICGKPMITLYGNHDRNRNNNASHTEAYLSHSEHANIVFKSFMPNPHIIRVSSDFAGFYWEDEFYRYAGIYWFSSETHSFPEAAEICNTDKPVIIFCHGIVFSIAEDPVDDTYDNKWILNAFEPYKAKIKCFIQGHSHRDAIRHAWETVPIISIDCDTVNTYSTVGTITEQAIAFITFDTDKISVVKVGRGEDFVVTADSADWRQEYTDTVPDENNPL